MQKRLQLIKPKRLKKNDMIGIVSPSSDIFSFPKRTKRASKALEDLGFKIIFAKHSKKKESSPKEKAEDIISMFTNDEVKAILCSTGGWTANTILEYLDYKVIRDNPKIFCGYSDITALNLAINKFSNLVTFNGPTLLPSFGEYGGPDKYTLKWFRKVLMNNNTIGPICNPPYYSDEVLFWDKEDNRKKKRKEATKITYIGEKKVIGALTGGNLSTLNILIGTKFEPDFEDKLLLIEDEGGSIETYKRRLTYLKHTEILSKINGLLVARPTNFSNSDNKSLIRFLRDIHSDIKIPIAVFIDAGHTSPLITLPIGIKCELNCKTQIIEVSESAVI